MIRRFLAKLTSVVGAIVLFSAAIAIVAGVIMWLREPGVPDQTILEIDLERDLVEYVPDEPVARAMLRRKIQLRDVTEALEVAAEDERVVALIARVGTGRMGIATIQELRDAVTRFKRAGKRAIAYAETFGEVGGDNGNYYLATAFSEIHLQPSGQVGLIGLVAETPFLRGTLEKLGLTPRLDHRQEYKTAMNVLTEREFTDAHREATQTVVESWFSQILRGISEARGLSEAQVRALFDAGPYFGDEAVEANLVDALAYRDEVYEKVKETAGEDANLLFLSTYLERAGRPHDEGDKIALIYGVGGVKRGRSGFDALSQTTSMGSDTISAAIRAAAADEDVRAIVLRVDSPGGSYVASDVIWRETVKAKEAGKPLVVSMGDVAGSGGYYVAMAADKIVAQPGTITGSIGVLTGKVLTSDFWEKLGVSWDEVATSARARIWSGLHDFSDEEWERVQALLDRIYDDFTAKVAKGRELPLDKVLEVAKGRIWTGEDAKALGLVDELGGLPTALKLARQAAGLADDAPIELEVFPKPKSPIRRLLEEPESSEEEAVRLVTLQLLEAVQPAFRLADQLGLRHHRAGLLLMQELGPPR